MLIIIQVPFLFSNFTICDEA